MNIHLVARSLHLVEKQPLEAPEPRKDTNKTHGHLGTNQGNKKLTYNLETAKMKVLEVRNLPTSKQKLFPHFSSPPPLCIFNVLGYPKEHQTQSSPLQWRLQVSEAPQELVAPSQVGEKFPISKNGPQKSSQKNDMSFCRSFQTFLRLFFPMVPLWVIFQTFKKRDPRLGPGSNFNKNQRPCLLRPKFPLIIAVCCCVVDCWLLVDCY